MPVIPSPFVVTGLTNKVGFEHIAESITIQGQTKEYEAGCYSKIENEIIDTKCSDKSRKYRTAFYWSWSDYDLLIETKWIGQRYTTV